jgi:hypothetical protein
VVKQYETVILDEGALDTGRPGFTDEAMEVGASPLSEQVPAPATAPWRAHFLLNLIFASQNCNSLNVSSTNRSMLTKATAICNINADIICLSDIRLGNKSKKFIDAVSMDYKFVL